MTTQSVKAIKAFLLPAGSNSFVFYHKVILEKKILKNVCIFEMNMRGVLNKKLEIPVFITLYNKMI